MPEELPSPAKKQWCEGHRRKVDQVVAVHLPRTGQGPKTFLLCLQCARELRNRGMLELVFKYSGRATKAGSRGATPPHIRPWDYELTPNWQPLVVVAAVSKCRKTYEVELTQAEAAILRLLGYKVVKTEVQSDS